MRDLKGIRNLCLAKLLKLIWLNLYNRICVYDTQSISYVPLKNTRRHLRSKTWRCLQVRKKPNEVIYVAVKTSLFLHLRWYCHDGNGNLRSIHGSITIASHLRRDGANRVKRCLRVVLDISESKQNASCAAYELCHYQQFRMSTLGFSDA